MKIIKPLTRQPTKSRDAWRTIAIGISVWLGLSGIVWAQDAGQKAFSLCIACHTIGEGKRVGPDLLHVTQRRPRAWLAQFIKSSQTLIKQGDQAAIAIFNEYNKIPMPDQPLSDAQIAAVLDYIASESNKKGPAKAAPTALTNQPSSAPAANTALPGQVQSTASGQACVCYLQGSAPTASSPSPSVASPSAAPEKTLTDAEKTALVNQGQDLFQGTLRFKNGGPSCISCHSIKNDAVISGGILAKDLSKLFSRTSGSLSSELVKIYLNTPPFPVMQQAYQKNKLEPSEISPLIAFLMDADRKHHLQKLPLDYGLGLLGAGAVGVVLLFALFAFIGVRRKKGTVYQSIFNRQLSSQ